MTSKNHHSRAMSSMAHEAKNDLKHDVENLAKHAKETVTGAVSKARETAEHMAAEVGEGAREKFDEMRGSIEEYYEAGRRQVRSLERTAESRIRENPLTAICIAAGIGVLVGMVWARR